MIYFNCLLWRKKDNRTFKWRFFHKMWKIIIFCNFNQNSRSNINLISRFLNLHILWVNFVSEWALARVSFKINFSSNHCSNPSKVKERKRTIRLSAWKLPTNLLNLHKNISWNVDFVKTKGSVTTVIGYRNFCYSLV